MVVVATSRPCRFTTTTEPWYPPSWRPHAPNTQSGHFRQDSIYCLHQDSNPKQSISKILAPPSNCWCQKYDMKQVPWWGPANLRLVLLAQCMWTDKHFLCKGKNYNNYAENIRCQFTQFNCTGNQGLTVCAPLFYKMFIFCKTAHKVGNKGRKKKERERERTSRQSGNSQENCAESHGPTIRSPQPTSSL